jgi:hypothetical protein
MSALTGRLVVLTAVSSLALLLGACAAPAPPALQASPQARPLRVAPAALHLPGLKDLTGMRPSDIAALLGPPDLRRDEPPAQLWQYRAADCILNLFFYREADGLRLARAETWQRSLSATAARKHCRDENAPFRARFTASPEL